MLRYIVRRLLSAIPVMFGLSIILFAFIHLLPGRSGRDDPGPARTARARRGDAHSGSGLDLPLYQQYLDYLAVCSAGDLGRSFINNRPVLNDFLGRFPGTIELTLAAMLFAVGLGIPLGRFAARRPQSVGDGIVER